MKARKPFYAVLVHPPTNDIYLTRTEYYGWDAWRKERYLRDGGQVLCAICRQPLTPKHSHPHDHVGDGDKCLACNQTH